MTLHTSAVTQIAVATNRSIYRDGWVPTTMKASSAMVLLCVTCIASNCIMSFGSLAIQDVHTHDEFLPSTHPLAQGGATLEDVGPNPELGMSIKRHRRDLMFSMAVPRRGCPAVGVRCFKPECIFPHPCVCRKACLACSHRCRDP